MTEQVATVKLSDNLHDAERLMKSKHIRHVPVISGDKMVGILSLTDLMRISFADSYGEDEGNVDTEVYSLLSIEQVMISKPKTVTPQTPIREVAEILANREFHALPVIDNDRLVGIVTTTDLINYLLEQY